LDHLHTRRRLLRVRVYLLSLPLIDEAPCHLDAACLEVIAKFALNHSATLPSASARNLPLPSSPWRIRSPCFDCLAARFHDPPRLVKSASASSGAMPWPLSRTRIEVSPRGPRSASTVTLLASASMPFQISSASACAGRAAASFSTKSS